MNNTGYIKIHRSILGWEWYDDKNTKIVFLHLLLNANFEDRNWHGILIKRGQVLIGRSKLAKSTCLSEQEIRTSISKLKSTNEITIESTNRFTIITLTKYDLYQSCDTKINQQNNHQYSQPTTNNQPTTNQQSTTTKELKEYKEIEISKDISTKKIFESEFENEIAKENHKILKNQTNSKKTQVQALKQSQSPNEATLSQQPCSKPIPIWLDQNLWNSFMEVRKKLKAVQSNKAIELLLSKLEDFKARGLDTNQIIRNSIENSWKGLFEPKQNQNSTSEGKFRLKYINLNDFNQKLEL
jgi:hypothetical protein